jgi:exopolyphosphatase/guanosine-5'-triphosphate,3'-diphosphate pyrophosphatase
LTGSYRKRFDRTSFPDLNRYDGQCLMLMVVILRLATLLNIRRLDNFLPEIEIKGDRNTLQLKFPEGWLKSHSLVLADLRSESNYLKDNSFALEFS